MATTISATPIPTTNPAAITGVETLIVFPNDLKALATFYQDILGLPVKTDARETGWIEFHAGNVGIALHRPVGAGGPKPVFQSANLERALAYLRSKGVLVGEIKMEAGQRYFDASGPDGHEFRFVDAPAAPEPQVENAIPVLSVANVPASIRFYRDKLGFKLDWGGENEKSQLCQISHDGQRIMLQRRGPVTPGCVWIGGSGLAPLWGKIKAGLSVTVVEKPTNQPWALEMRIADPDGNILWFGSEPLKDVPFGKIVDSSGP